MSEVCDQNFQFRTALLRIQDSLSRDDRVKLHFLFGEDIPRVLRENGSLEEALAVLETLINRLKISPDNYDYLIHGLKAIQRPDCIERLKDYQRLVSPTKIPTCPEDLGETHDLGIQSSKRKDHAISASEFLESLEEADGIKLRSNDVKPIKFECPESPPLDIDAIDLRPFEDDSCPWTEEYSKSLNLPYHPRRYQIEIIRDVIQHGNSIVCLRTGSGKTFIAAVLIKYYFIKKQKEHRDGPFHALFFVPRKAIRLQQAKALAEVKNLRVKICDDDETIEHWMDQAQVIVATPQKFVNTLDKRTVSLSQVDVMIFDECHNTSGGNPYCGIMKFYLCQSKGQSDGEKPKIIGLTASITAKDAEEKRDSVDKNVISICSKLACGNISTVCQPDNIAELNQEISRPQNDPFEFILPMPRDNYFVQCLARVENMIKKIMAEMDQNVLLKDKAIGSPPFIAELVLLKQSLERKGQMKQIIICDYLLLVTKKYLALNDLPFHMVLEHMLQRIEKYHGDYEIPVPIESVLYEYCEGVLSATIADLEKKPVRNSKLENLVTLVKRHAHDDAKGLILVQTTFYAETLHRFILNHPELQNVVRPTWLVGQTSFDYAQTIHEQEERLKLFQEGKANVLVATDIVQEGLDVPTCSYVIRYEFVSDEIGTIQSRGRARAQNSAYYLITESGSINHQREQNNRNREENMEEVIAKWPHIDKEIFRRNVQTATSSLINQWEQDLKNQATQRDLLKKVGKKNGTICCRRCNKNLGDLAWLRRRNTTYFINEPQFFIDSEPHLASTLKNFQENQVLGDVKCQCGNSLGGYQRYTDRPDLGALCALNCKQIKFSIENHNGYIEFAQWSKNNQFDIEELEEN